MKNNFIDDAAIARYRKRVLRKPLDSSHIYHEFTDRLLSRLDYIVIKPLTIVNFGWCHSDVHQKLLSLYPNANIIDIHEVKDLYALGEHSVDCVVAHFSLLCYSDIKIAIQFCHWVLQENGLFLFVDFGLDTLKEVRDAFLSVDTAPRINQFYDMHDIGDVLNQLAFSDPVMDRELITLAYQTPKAFLQELKAMGMMSADSRRNKGLLGVKQWRMMLESFERFKETDYYPISVELMYGHAWKAAPKIADEVVISIDKIQRR